VTKRGGGKLLGKVCASSGTLQEQQIGHNIKTIRRIAYRLQELRKFLLQCHKSEHAYIIISIVVPCSTHQVFHIICITSCIPKSRE